LNAITGAGGIKIDIRTTPTPQQQQTPAAIVPMDHYPSWKLHKNPFWRVKHPNGQKLASVTPILTASGDVQEVRSPVFAYEQHEDISGVVTVHVPPGKKLEHLGIKIQFIGRIDMSYGVNDTGRPHYDFVSLSKELAPPGILFQSITEMPFLFRNMDKEHESYRGRNVSVRYFVKVIVERKFLPPVQKEHDIWIQVMGQPPAQNEAIKMEVGIEDCLHIEFEYERRVYHLQDTILGKIHFLLVRIKIKHMELAVIRRETSGDGVAAAAGGPNQSSMQPSNDTSNVFTETQTLVKYEIMDGAPVKGEVIPVKLSLRGIPADLTPTYNSVNNRFSVRYFINLVLVDEEDRRYFKQQEIILWRKELG
jgi:vacuolar protein sorting-associated protein 26